MAQDRFGLTQRRACRVVGQPRSTQRRPAPAPGDRDLRARLHEIARSRPRAGYRTAHALLVREGWTINRKKVLRLWREEGLKVQPRHRKRRRPAPGEQVHRAERPDHVWAIDFQFDATADGRMVKIANVVDEFTREALAGRVGRSCTATDLVQVLDGLASDRGAPGHIRCDNGPEMIAWTVRDWCRSSGTNTSYIEPGSPWENPFVESYNARMRDELLALTEFTTLTEAKVLIEDWRIAYNTERPHSSLGYLTPLEFHRAWTQQHQPEPALS
jgi:transposase InsO family protein